MLRKIMAVAVVPLGLLGGANVANASINNQCPYEVMDWDVDQALIDELCEEWRRSTPGQPKGKDPLKPPKVPDECATGRSCHQY